MFISNLYCTECNSKFYIPRMKHRKREQGHIKDIYCYKCKKITKFKETEYGTED